MMGRPSKVFFPSHFAHRRVFYGKKYMPFDSGFGRGIRERTGCGAATMGIEPKLAGVEAVIEQDPEECLAQIVPLGERPLRHAVKEYTEHYHVERNHQGLENGLINERQSVVDMNSAIECHERLGGVLDYYERRAA
jgi:hypothetical protein